MAVREYWEYGIQKLKFPALRELIVNLVGRQTCHT